MTVPTVRLIYEMCRKVPAFKHGEYVKFNILIYFGELNNISHEQQQLIQLADDEYCKDPLTIEIEVVLRRLVKQYLQEDIPDAYKGLLHDKHRIILNKVIS